MHIKATDGTPFYIGKGKGNRFKHKSNRSTLWNNIVKKYGFDIILLEENITEQEAFEKEKYWIKRIGRRDLGLGPLVNFTDGGDGVSGLKGFEGINNPFFGKKHSEESLKKMSKSHMGNTAVKSRVNFDAWNKGLKLTEEHKKKLSDNHSRKRKVIDIISGDIFDSVQDAAKFTNLNINTLRNYLSGRRENKTNLKFL
jgi:hypothetical protein